MKEISRKDFVKLLAAGAGTAGTFFIAGWLPRRNGSGIMESYDIVQASLLPGSTDTDLPTFVISDEDIKSSIKYAGEQFDAGFN